MSQGGRWGTKREKRRKETKKRAPRAKETVPRKKRVTKAYPIPAKGDIEGLARHRKCVSKVKRSSRLAELESHQLKRYAAHARISLRTAQRDRGHKLHPGRLSEDKRNAVALLWSEMVEAAEGDLRGHKACTLAKLRERAKAELSVELSQPQAWRIVSASKVSKPRSRLIQPNNNPRMRRLNFNNV